jgi:hypothetical protein
MAKLNWNAVLMLVAVALFAVGCQTTQPIYNVIDSPVTTSGPKPATMDDVQKAIIRAGAQLGWAITPEKPGRLTGRITLRTHQAVADIEYSTKSYSIKYRDSVDLGAKDGQIHRNYNGWVQNLDKAIRAQLLVP